MQENRPIVQPRRHAAENYCPGCMGLKDYYACSSCTATVLMRCRVCDAGKVLPDSCGYCAVNRHERRKLAKLNRKSKILVHE